MQLEYPLIPAAYIKLSFLNVNCFDENDHFELYVSDDFDVIPSNIPFVLNGCDGYQSNEFKKTVSGTIYYHWIVTRNGVTTNHYDTLYLSPFEQRTFEIQY